MLYSQLSDPMTPPVIPSDVDYLRSSGDTVPGIGAAYFSTTTTGSPYARTFTAADSRVFEMLPEQDGWSLAAFGMLPNTIGNTAQSSINRQAHQQAVDHALWLAMNGKGTQRLMFTPGTYHIDGVIKVFKHQSDDSFAFISIEISAPARGYATNQRTEIRNTDDDQPCYAVQSARSVKFSNFSIQGANANYSLSFADLLGPPTWANQAGMRDTPWSPACGIVVDPFGSIIENGDAYPGLEEYYTYNLRGSSTTVIENMECKGFPVGILLSPSVNTQNNDSVMIRDCDISYNKVAIAVCQSQNRAVRIENCRIHAAHTMIDTESYGNGNGAFPLANNLNVTYCKYLINGTGGVSRAKLSNSDVETTYSLGAWRGSFPLDIEGCQIKLISPNALTNPQQAAIDYHLFAGATVNVIGGYVGFYSNVGVPLGITGGGRVNFKSCAIDCPPMLRDPELVRYEGVSLRYVNGGNAFGADMQFVASTDTRLAVRVDAKMPPDGTAALYAPSYTRFRNVGGPTFIDLAPALTITATGDGLATFTAPTPGKFNVGEWLSSWDPFNGLMPDETTPVELRFVPIGKVKSIVGSTVTLEAVPRGFTTGTYVPYVQYLPSFRPRCYGTATLGSNVLTGVTPTYHGFQVGDRLLASEGVPKGAYVTAVNNGAGTITISLTATGSGVSRIRTGELNLDDAPRSAAPGSGTVTYVGDYFRNTAATVNGDDMVLRGWIATSIGNPGTLEPQYVSTVTPAT